MLEPMCARYTLTSPMDLLVEIFLLTEVEEGVQPRHNIAPTQLVPVVLEGHRLRRLRWGLIPPWAKDVRVGARMINARVETAAERPAFRDALARRRCLVPADGFFEWKDEAGRKQPWYIRRRDGCPFAFAGLWDTWRGEGGDPVRSFALLTGEPNELVARIHDRMPCILRSADWGAWLDPALPVPGALGELTRPYPAEELEAYRVSPWMGSPKHEGPRCVERIDPEPAGDGQADLFP